MDHGNNDFFDPLRNSDDNGAVSGDALQDFENSSSAGLSSAASVQSSAKEWTSFKRILMQKFPVSKMISISAVSDLLVFYYFNLKINMPPYI